MITEKPVFSESQPIGEMKLKGAEKKQQMLEKFKKKGEKVMNNLATKSLIMSVDDNEELCLLCH